MTPISLIKVFSLQRKADKGKEFVAGLLWLPLASDTKKIKENTARLATEQNVDLVVHRKGGVIQVGLASTKDGAHAGLYSAAAVVSKTIEVESGDRNVLAAVQVPDGRWLYVAQRDGAILPDGDLLGDEDSIRARMLEDHSVGDWDRVYAPDHWGFGNSEERNFVSFLPAKNGKIDYHKWWKIQPIGFSVGGLRRYVVPVAVMMAIGFGASIAWNKWHQKKLADQMAQLSMLKSMQTSQPKVIPPPWPSQPSALAVSRACESVFNRAALWPGGWLLQDVKCSGSAMMISWSCEDSGRASFLKRVVPQAIISPDGKRASLSIPLELPKMNSKNEPAPGVEGVMTKMRDVAEKYGLDLKISQESAPSQLPGAPAPKQQEIKDWQSINWSVSKSALKPSDVIRLLDGDGFRLNSIGFEFANGSVGWSLEGVQYAKK